jgi:hypothetical protein
LVCEEVKCLQVERVKMERDVKRTKPIRNACLEDSLGRKNSMDLTHHAIEVRDVFEYMARMNEIEGPFPERKMFGARSDIAAVDVDVHELWESGFPASEVKSPCQRTNSAAPASIDLSMGQVDVPNEDHPRTRGNFGIDGMG